MANCKRREGHSVVQLDCCNYGKGWGIQLEFPWCRSDPSTTEYKKKFKKFKHFYQFFSACTSNKLTSTNPIIRYCPQSHQVSCAFTIRKWRGEGGEATVIILCTSYNQDSIIAQWGEKGPRARGSKCIENIQLVLGRAEDIQTVQDQYKMWEKLWKEISTDKPNLGFSSEKNCVRDSKSDLDRIIK